MKMNEFSYNSAPSIKRSRSVFNLSHSVHSHLFHGDLRVVDCIEVLPGDDVELNLPILNRMSSPIAPIMGNIYQKTYAFFVPLRLVWEHAEEFFGANKDSFGIQTKEYKIPSYQLSNFYGYEQPEDMLAYIYDDKVDGSPQHNRNAVGFEFGLPYSINNFILLSDNQEGNVINALPLRAYCLIWNEFFRDENLCDPFIIDFGDNVNGVNDIFRNGKAFTYGSDPIYVCKGRDRFTSCLPFAQKGSPVRVPVGGIAPVKTAPQDLGFNNGSVSILFETTPGGAIDDRSVAAFSGGALCASSNKDTGTLSGITPTNLYTDLGVATGATVNELRMAFQTQRYLELLARGGTRYVEYLNAVFGVSNGDARLQRPEFLGGVSTRINIDQIMSTAGYENGQNSKLGAMGAFSITGSENNYLAVKGFTEHGYILILTCTKYERSYCEGIDPLLLKTRTLDIYNPAFAHIGETPVPTINLTAKGDGSETFFNKGMKEPSFGFQEAWSEYRHLKNKTCGYLDPNVENSLDYWTLAEKDVPCYLNEEFIKEDRRALTRCLTTGDMGPDYIVSYYVDLKMRRLMPVHSIPGLIDHL